MSILTIKTVQTGLVGVQPSIAYINTTNTVAEVTATGFLNKEVANGESFFLPCMALVATKESASAVPVVRQYNVEHNNSNWSLTLDSTEIIKFAGKESDGGGSATIAITVTGVLATDIVFAQVESSTNAVEVQKVTPTADTVTVLLSGDPGAGTVISYQVIRTVE